MNAALVAFIVVGIAAIGFFVNGGKTTTIASAVQMVGLGGYPVEEWEHGLKTSRVIATRYKNDTIGFNIGFEFPKNVNDADRAEVSDFVAAHGGNIYEGGGYAGAPAYAVFKDVKDKESANQKLREILPAMSQLMEDLGNGKEIPKVIDVNAKVWPDTDAPSSDKLGGSIDNFNQNGIQYKKIEVSPGKWQWAVDAEVMKAKNNEATHRRNLFSALQTRILTDAEMAEVSGYGRMINIEEMVPYMESDKQKELNEALLQQFRLRAVAAAHNSP